MVAEIDVEALPASFGHHDSVAYVATHARDPEIDFQTNRLHLCGPPRKPRLYIDRDKL
jgi:hypothetical protein